jgi:CheY-like chemotaxis protein
MMSLAKADRDQDRSMTEASEVTILIVEDSDEVANIVIIGLRKTGWNVHHAVNAQAALDFLRNKRPDVILLDIGLPVMNGWQLLDEIYKDEDNLTIPVIVLSAYTDGENLKTGQLYNIYRYLGKPVTPQDLRQVIKMALDSG